MAWSSAYYEAFHWLRRMPCTRQFACITKQAATGQRNPSRACRGENNPPFTWSDSAVTKRTSDAAVHKLVWEGAPQAWLQTTCLCLQVETCRRGQILVTNSYLCWCLHILARVVAGPACWDTRWSKTPQSHRLPPGCSDYQNGPGGPQNLLGKWLHPENGGHCWKLERTDTAKQQWTEGTGDVSESVEAEPPSNLPIPAPCSNPQTMGTLHRSFL